MAEDSCYREKNIVKTFSAATDGDACNMYNPVKNVFVLGEFPPQAVTPCTIYTKVLRHCLYCFIYANFMCGLNKIDKT